MTAVTVTQPIPTAPQSLRKLKQRELLEQIRLSIMESLKNNPKDWMRVGLAVTAAAKVYQLNANAGIDGILPATFVGAAFLSEDPKVFLVGAGVVEAADLLFKFAPGLNPTYYTKPTDAWYKQRCAMIGGVWNGQKTVPSCTMRDGSIQ